MTAIVAAIAATIGLLKAIPPAFKLAKQLIDGSVFVLDIKVWGVELIKKMEEGFKRVEDGQLNQINARRFYLDADERNAHFETDARGKTEWVSRRWRLMTGLDNSQARGSGWENGIAPDVQDAVLREWQAAIDHQRTFDRLVVYVDREGRRTTMKVIASPMRDRDGNVMQFHGICVPPDAPTDVSHSLHAPCPSSPSPSS